MLLQNEIYYKRFGVRKITQLINPPTFSTEIIQLPRSSVYHTVSHDRDVTMPDPSDRIFAPYTKKIVISHVSELVSTEGNPKHLSKPVKMLFRDWQLKNNRKFRWADEPDKVAIDALSLITYNYGLLHEVYRYVNMPMNEYYDWLNLEKTVWSNMGKVASSTHRQQFIIKDLPDQLPSVGMLKMFASQVSLRVLRTFINPELLFVLDLWRWLDPETREFSTLSVLKPEELKYINIVLRFKDRFTVVNLQRIEDWNAGISDKSTPVNIPQLKPIQLQRFVLKMLLSLQTSAIMPEPTTDETTNGSSDSEQEDDLADYDDEDDTSEHVQVNNDTESPSQTQDEAIDPSKQLTKVRTSKEIEKQLEKDAAPVSSAINIDDLIKSVDEELEILEKVSSAPEDESNNEDVTDETFIATPEEVSQLQSQVFGKVDPTEKLLSEINKQAEQGVITAQNYRTLVKQIEQSKTLKSPKDPSKTISEYVKVSEEDITINPEAIKIQDMSTVMDKSMLNSSLKEFSRKYVKDVLPKDVQANIAHLSNAGIIVRDYQIEEESSAMGQYEHHTVKIRPIDGVESTLHFRIPKVNDEGEFMAGNVRLRMRNQRFDQPIRKISPISVALSSYYGKVFVNRCERKQFDDMDWLSNQIMQIGLAGGNDTIKKITPARIFDNKFIAPRIYSSMSMRFKQLVLKDCTLMFDHKERISMFPEMDITTLEKDGKILCGKSKQNEPIVVDDMNVFHVLRNGTLTPIGNIYNLTGIAEESSPVSFSELKVFAKSIPLGVVMGYYIGFSKLVKLLGAKVQVVDRGSRRQLQPYEYKLTFKDKYLILDKRDSKSALLLSGYNFYKDTIKNYDLAIFDKKDVYLLLLEQRGLSARYLKELETLNELFVDPITESILREMNEPVTFQGLLMRSNELLLTDYHPDTNDMRYMRIRGYERVAGLMYRELINGVREYKARNIRGKSQVSINPYAVWRAITQDQTVKLSEDINPINDAKETEAVTYVGADGRSKDAMSKESREYHPSDMGVISEATVDSGDVGINAFMSGNPKFKSVRGIIQEDGFNRDKDGATSLLSTSALLAPFSVNDDAKRVNFVSIQNSHTVACEGYHQPQIRTGYESVMPFRVGKLYAYMAQDDGKVIELTDKVITIEYKNKERVGIQIGTQYGRSEGSLYPHEIATPLKQGQSFKKNDPIAYNTGFFEPDFMNPKQIIMKTSLKAKVAIMDTTQTLEDSDSITPNLSQRLSTRVVKEKSFIINFNQSIRNVTNPGTEVKPNDIIFIIEDAITSGLDVFDSDTIEALSRLSNLAPKAKVNGKIDRYEVYYNGDLEDMTPSLRKLASYSNKQMLERTKNTDHVIKDGRVNEEFRVEGKPLHVDTAVIKVYIIINDKAQLGDKVVFANQLKSVVSEVMSCDMKTERGETIDAIFSYMSIGKRITLSPLAIGTCSVLLDQVAKKAIQLYRS